MGRKRKVPPTPTPHPAQEGMRRASDQLRKLADSPLWRELRERARGLTESSERAQLREKLLKASELPSVTKVGELLRQYSKPNDEPPPAPTKRRGRGGRPRILTKEQITCGIGLTRKHSDLKFEATCDLLRQELHTNASNTVLWKHIISPARQNSGT